MKPLHLATRLTLRSGAVLFCAGLVLTLSEPGVALEWAPKGSQDPQGATVGDTETTQAPQAPQATELPPVTIADTARMDAEILALIDEKIAAVKAAPGDVDAHVELGMTYEANTYWVQAEQCYRNALALMPVTAENEQTRMQWLYRQAVVQYKNGNILESIENMTTVAGVFKNTAVVQARLGEMLFRVGRIDESHAAWERAVASEKESKQGPWAASRVGLAQLKLYQGNAEGALELIDAALAIDPQFRAAHYQRGVALSELGRDDEADMAFARGVNAFVTYPPDPHQGRLGGLERGYNRRMMNIENMVAGGRVQEALTQLEALRTQRPTDHRILNLIAKVYTTTNQMDKALETYAQSEELAPNDYAAKIESSFVLLNMGRFAEAAEKAQIATRLAPGIGRNYYYLGLAQYFPTMAAAQTQDPQKQQEAAQAKQQALATLQVAMAHGCTEPQLFQYISQIYAEVGRLPEMIRYGEEFAKQHATNPSAHIFLSKVYFTIFSQTEPKSREYLGRAEAAVLKAQEIGPNHPEVMQIAPQILAALDAAKAELEPEAGPALPDDQPQPDKQ